MRWIFALLLLSAASLAGLYAAGLLPADVSAMIEAARSTDAAEAKPTVASPSVKPDPEPVAPLVSVARTSPEDFVATVLVTGTFVAREEILVAPEVDGLRVLELRAEEGDRVAKGDVLAILVRETFAAKLAESDAALVRADAAIARAKSGIVEAEARVKEADQALARAVPLKRSGDLSASTYDQREATARTSRALLSAAGDSLLVAKAEKTQVEAQRRETVFQLEKTSVTTPSDGLISRRSARVGGMASVGATPMFHIIAKGEIELDAEVPETELHKIAQGDVARITAAGLPEAAQGKVRLISPEVDRATRLGRVRIFLGDNPELRIGAFGRGVIETERTRGLAIPAAAVMHGPEGPYVLVVMEGKVARRPVAIGLRVDDRVEITSGLSENDLVVAKAGTFLRDGDAVRPAFPDAAVSEIPK